MKTLSKKTIIIAIIMIMISMLFSTNIYAAGSFSINKSSTTLTTGGTTTITVTANGCAGQFNISSSNTSVATVSTSSVWLDNSSATITVTSKAAGTANINITATDVTDTDLNEVTGTKTCKVTVSNPEVQKPQTNTNTNTNTNTSTSTNTNTSTGSSSNKNNNTTSNNNNNTTTKPQVVKSSDSKLAKLEIAEGVITPVFSATLKEYAINVPNEITKLSIAAVANSSKATVNIEGNEELKIGENNIEIIVTAEDGSKTTYTIKATRKQPALSLQSLIATYIDENGEEIVLELSPKFSFDVYEYSIEELLPHTINELNIKAIANRENSTIEILGNEELQAGKNTIKIKTTVKDEAGLEEQKTYTILVEREEEPEIIPLTTENKMMDWFSAAGSAIAKWVKENFNKIIIGMLIVATVAFAGLTIYFMYDYKNYQKLLAKLAELNKENLVERANIALTPEMANNKSVENEILETKTEEIETTTDNIKTTEKKIRGRRFK